jgi:transcriptional regulator with XRE-family HTH domain
MRKNTGRRKEALPIDSERVKELISESGLSQASFARQIGVSKQAVTDWLKKEEAHPEMIISMANFFQVSPRYLTGEIADKTEIIKNSDGSFTFMNDTEAFGLAGEELRKHEDEAISRALTDGRKIISLSDYMSRINKERESAKRALEDFLNTSYMRDSWKRVGSDDLLAKLVSELRLYLDSLPPKD